MNTAKYIKNFMFLGDFNASNQLSCFQHCKVFETGLDIHLLTVTEFKMSFQKLKPKIIDYRDYNNFDKIHSRK